MMMNMMVMMLMMMMMMVVMMMIMMMIFCVNFRTYLGSFSESLPLALRALKLRSQSATV